MVVKWIMVEDDSVYYLYRRSFWGWRHFASSNSITELRLKVPAQVFIQYVITGLGPMT